MISGSEPLKVLDCQYKFSGILFFKIAFLQNQVVKSY